VLAGVFSLPRLEIAASGLAGIALGVVLPGEPSLLQSVADGRKVDVDLAVRRVSISRPETIAR